MKKWILFLLVFCLAFSGTLAPAESPRAGWKVTVAAGKQSRNDLKNRKEFETERDRLYEVYRKRCSSRRNELKYGRIVMNGYTMEIYRTLSASDLHLWY